MDAQRRSLIRAFAAAALGATGVAARPVAGADGRSPGAVEQPSYDTPYPRGDSWNSWYGPSRPSRDKNVASWAIGTFHGRNGGNGNEETVTIRPDGSAELRAAGEAPGYGTFAGETLTIGKRISRVQAARDGIVIDGAYYRR